MKKVDYYFDFLSPFSYFSWINTAELRQNSDYQIELKPVVMGTLFNNWGIKGPGEIAPKRVQMLKYCFQYAALNNIDFIPPKTHPFNPLYALRLATNACSKEHQEKVINLLWNFCWGKGNELGDEDALIELLDNEGLDGKELLESTYQREVKLELKINTKEAIAHKVYGVPSFVYNNELYWGNDSIVFLTRALKDDPIQWDKQLFQDRLKDVDL